MNKDRIADDNFRLEFGTVMAKQTELLEANTSEIKVKTHELLVVRHQLLAATTGLKRLELQMNDMQNQLKQCNIRIEGKEEEPAENLRTFIIELGAELGVANISTSDIIAVYRLGKRRQQQHMGALVFTQRPY